MLAIVALVASLGAAPVVAVPASTTTFTILHTNDFHGQLEPAGSNPGIARVATVVKDVESTVGSDNVLLVDAGDEMQGSLLSNLQKGAPTIAAFNAMEYDVATFGNHEFDWGQPNLDARTTQANYPYVTANIVQNDTGDCATAGWTPPTFASGPYSIQTVGTLSNEVTVGFIGVTTTETPVITLSTSTAGLCFKDPAESILHYYDALKAQVDVVVVLSHLGYPDGGYGYGIPVYGDQTLASKLNAAGKPANLIIGGHSHTNLTAATMVGSTAVVQAYYSGRRVGRADVTVSPGGDVSISWQSLPVVPPTYVNGIPVPGTGTAVDPTLDGVVQSYASDSAYQALINTPVGYVQTDLSRNYNGDSMMGDFVDDAIYGSLNSDATTDNDIDLFLNNAGGIRTDWCDKPGANPGEFSWSSDAGDCQTGVWSHDPMLLNYGQMFTILPFGNATVVGDMTGAQILQVLNQSATLGKGAIQPAGIRYSFYAYTDTNPGPQPYAWGAFDYCVINKVTEACDPLEMDKTYRVGTNEFLAPAGGDNYAAFKYMTNITYWGDMLDAVNSYVAANYGSALTPYKGPNDDGMLDGRITRDGTATPDSGSIIPITILHHNDSHGNLTKGTYVGYTQLATLIKQERLHNPDRTLLLEGGDQIQGDAMMYYFKSSYSGFASDGTPIPGLETNPMIAAMNSMDYDAMTLGNHEFNYGSAVFDGIFEQAEFPLLGANVSDSGAYGLDKVGPGGEGVQPYIEKNLDGIKIGILGITNHRVPNYELPSNIPGLTFSNPIKTGQDIAPTLKANDDVVIALTHIGFTTNPKSVEVDDNVDTNFAAAVPGVDVIIGSHSHTNPASPEAPYKFLPTIVGGPNDTPVLINQAYRYNNTLGEVVIGVRAKAGGGYEVVSRAGQYLSVTGDVAEDAATKALLQPYVEQLAAYNSETIGQTTVPIDTLQAFTEETNGANLQADASVWELAQHGIDDVDVHLSGAMTNKLLPSRAGATFPYTLTIADMFAGMPYENSLVTMRMNGPQLKAVLERAYRNYYFYTYVAGYGGYSHYTTCMLDTDFGNHILYRDTSPDMPDGNNVVGLQIGDKLVDFSDAATYYKVSTVNYLAAGACNFNDNGVSLWPLDEIVNDTQYYVRDAVIDYIKAMGVVSPAIEGRLVFGDAVAPTITITSPTATTYPHSAVIPLTYSATDAESAIASVVADLDGTPTSAATLDLLTLALGTHTFTVTATDVFGNSAMESVAFMITTTAGDLASSVSALYDAGSITKTGVRDSLLAKLTSAVKSMDKGNDKAAMQQLNAFINEVTAQTGKAITADAAAILIADAEYLIAQL